MGQLKEADVSGGEKRGLSPNADFGLFRRFGIVSGLVDEYWQK
jgi:hypothetical protein